MYLGAEIEMSFINIHMSLYITKLCDVSIYSIIIG